MKNVLKEVFKRLHIVHNIHIKHKHPLRKKSYSMEGEDLEIIKLTKHINKGFYVDAGCYHPLHLNNTYLLYKKNWNGMNISNQVKEMAMADIVISLPGSDLMNCIFLYPLSCPFRPFRSRVIYGRVLALCDDGDYRAKPWPAGLLFSASPVLRQFCQFADHYPILGFLS